MVESSASGLRECGEDGFLCGCGFGSYMLNLAMCCKEEEKIQSFQLQSFLSFTHSIS